MFKVGKSKVHGQNGDTRAGDTGTRQEEEPDGKENLVCWPSMASSSTETHLFIFSWVIRHLYIFIDLLLKDKLSNPISCNPKCCKLKKKKVIVNLKDIQEE